MRRHGIETERIERPGKKGSIYRYVLKDGSVRFRARANLASVIRPQKTFITLEEAEAYIDGAIEEAKKYGRYRSGRGHQDIKPDTARRTYTKHRDGEGRVWTVETRGQVMIGGKYKKLY